MNSKFDKELLVKIRRLVNEEITTHYNVSGFDSLPNFEEMIFNIKDQIEFYGNSEEMEAFTFVIITNLFKQAIAEIARLDNNIVKNINSIETDAEISGADMFLEAELPDAVDESRVGESKEDPEDEEQLEEEMTDTDIDVEIEEEYEDDTDENDLF